MKNALFTFAVALISGHAFTQKMLYNDSLLLCSGKKTLVQVIDLDTSLQISLDTISFSYKGNVGKLDEKMMEQINKLCHDHPGSLPKTLGTLTSRVSNWRHKNERMEALSNGMNIVEKLDTLGRYDMFIVTDGEDIHLLSHTDGKYIFNTQEIKDNDDAVRAIDEILLFMNKEPDIHITNYLTDINGKSYLIFNPKVSNGKIDGDNKLEINPIDANKYRGDFAGVTTDSIPANVYATKIGDVLKPTFPENQLDKPKNPQIDYGAENTDILLLTAYNFDFTSTVKSNYVGMLNIRTTNIGGTRWAINGGFTKINYSLGDYSKDSSSYRAIENVKQNPLDTASTGYTYYRQLNQYSINKTTSSMSLFGQVMMAIKKKAKHKIFAHFHSELFISKFTTNTEMTTIAQDTLVAVAGTPNVVKSNINGNSSTSSFTSLDGYFGLGMTGLFNFSSNTTLFVQPTAGMVVFGTPVNKLIFNQARYAGNYRPTQKSVATFYLVKFSLSQKISENSSIVIGSEIRGYLPNKIPQFAIYAGLTIDFADLAKFL